MNRVIRSGAFALLALTCAGAQVAWGNGEELYLECPCRVVGTGERLTVSAGVRSFRDTYSSPLRIVVRGRRHPEESWNYDQLGVVQVTDSVPANGRLPRKASSTRFAVDVAEERTLELVLEELEGDDWVEQDRALMEMPVNPAGRFRVDDLDYLKDADGDGVADANERLRRTNPDDSESTPGRSTIDVVVLYSDGYDEQYRNPATRISHLFTVANEIVDSSGIDLRFRVVGVVPVKIEDEENSSSRVDVATVRLAAERHAADVTVVFRSSPADVGSCGWSPVGAYRGRGHFGAEELHALSGWYATVVGRCSGRTLAHELGHLMGLHHSVWQDDFGTWRWSRGYGVEGDFHTTMSYGSGGVSIPVFSNPDLNCTGLLQEEKPCGAELDEVDASDATTSLDAVRFLIAAHRRGLPDSDRDGFVDAVDAMPDDADEWWDTDGDGTGDNADLDDDNDGRNDVIDAFPRDASETRDTDDDGVGDNADPFPEDASETADTDGDGVGDNADAFPEDPSESVDSDGDGVGDNADAFPEDATEFADTDGDEAGDRADLDADGDGVKDALDLFPADATRSELASWLFVGEQEGDLLGTGLAGDHSTFVVTAPGFDAGTAKEAGAVYLLANSDLAALDALDGTAERRIHLSHIGASKASWRILGAAAGTEAGASVASVGDMDGDSKADVLIGAPGQRCAGGGRACGALYFVSGTDLGAVDAADGTTNRTISLDQIGGQPASWMVRGSTVRGRFGASVAFAGTDDDGTFNVLVGAPARTDAVAGRASGTAYMLATGGLAAADAADGTADGSIAIEHLLSQHGNWQFTGETRGDGAGAALATVPDLDGDGRPEALIGASDRVVDGRAQAGAAYLVSSRSLTAADAADGNADQAIELGRVAALSGSWKLQGEASGDRAGSTVSAATDREAGVWLLAGRHLVAANDLASADSGDGTVDGVIDLGAVAWRPNSWELPSGGRYWLADELYGDGHPALITARSWGFGDVWLMSAAKLAAADGVDDLDGFVDPTGALAREHSWRVRGARSSHRLGSMVAPIGDVDGDGAGDLLLGAPGGADSFGAGLAYLLLAADLPALDRADRKHNRALHLGNFASDTDGDGDANPLDVDDDGDGVPDVSDAFPLDPSEWSDTDGDFVGDEADVFPDDAAEAFDTDGDGIGDNADLDDDGDGIADADDPRPRDTDDDGLPNRIDPDDDNDGVADADDDLPIDASESVDTDGDGRGNRADTDDDNDGVRDRDDAFPRDATESVDSDGDGVGDNADAFPQDAAEQADTDGDGTGDNADTDDDGDGIPDATDAFPLDADATRDADGDGVANGRDAFPRDATEWNDADSDGVGDNADADDDNDGVSDVEDVFPNDPSRTSFTSYRFEPEAGNDRLGVSVASAGDLDGDGRPEVLLGASMHGEWGAVYVVSSRDLASADAADGLPDGRIDVSRIAAQPGSWKLVGEDGLSAGSALAPVGDLDGDGVGEVGVGAAELVGGVYLVSAANLAAADAADGAADGEVNLGELTARTGSWKLTGGWGACMGCSLVDVPGVRLMIGQPGRGVGDEPGTTHLLAATGLGALDGSDGDADGEISMSNHVTRRFVGERERDSAGNSLGSADFDGDGEADAVIAAFGFDADRRDNGAVYLVGSRDFSASQIELGGIAGETHSWKIVGKAGGEHVGQGVATGDVDGDGQPDLVFTQDSGAVANVILGTQANLARLDRADGERDGVIVSENVGTHPGSWRITRSRAWFAPRVVNGHIATIEFDGDGFADLLVGLNDEFTSGAAPFARAYLVSAAAVVSKPPGQLPIAGLVKEGAAYALSEPFDSEYGEATVASAGDTDGDGLTDFLIGVSWWNTAGTAYLVTAADLPHLDASDGRKDHRIDLSRIVTPRP